VWKLVKLKQTVGLPEGAKWSSGSMIKNGGIDAE
jgi:hypothetical protein